MRLVCVSDTHNYTDELVVPDGDVLVHAGDLTMNGSERELRVAAEWLASLPHRRKVVVAGNHDFGLEDGDPAVLGDVIYLRDRLVEVDGFSFFGMPWQHNLPDWAFYLPPEQIRNKWSQVPPDLDVLVTHVPAFGVLDFVPGAGHKHVFVGHVGAGGLHARMTDLVVHAAEPTLHVHGHIHECYGREVYFGMCESINAAICDRSYEPVNAPVVVDL